MIGAVWRAKRHSLLARTDSALARVAQLCRDNERRNTLNRMDESGSAVAAALAAQLAVPLGNVGKKGNGEGTKNHVSYLIGLAVGRIAKYGICRSTDLI